MKELKEIDEWEVTLSGTFLQVNPESIKRLIGAADITTVTPETPSQDDLNVKKITPRQTLQDADFSDIWWVGDYGKGKDNYIAIHLMNGLSTGGFSIQTGDKVKGTEAFTITGHYTMENQNLVPFEVYVGTQPEA